LIQDTEFHPCDRFEWERIVRRVRMPAKVKLLAMVLASYADQDGSRVRPGLDRLAGVTGQGERTIQRHLAELRGAFGLIEEVSRGGGRGRTARAAEYRLVVPDDLLDRAVLLGTDERPSRNGHRVDSDATQVARQLDGSDTDRDATYVARQSPDMPVDNSEWNATHMASGNGEPDPIETPKSATFGDWDAISEQLRRHSCVTPPPIYQPPIDHPCRSPANATTRAREEPTAEQASASWSRP
jgi:hypothetical protein